MSHLCGFESHKGKWWGPVPIWPWLFNPNFITLSPCLCMKTWHRLPLNPLCCVQTIMPRPRLLKTFCIYQICHHSLLHVHSQMGTFIYRPIQYVEIHFRSMWNYSRTSIFWPGWETKICSDDGRVVKTRSRRYFDNRDSAAHEYLNLFKWS